MSKIDIKNNRSGCPISTSLDIIGDKWSLIVVRDLFIKRCTFSEMINLSKECIATNILSDRLKKLKFRGVIDFGPNTKNKNIKEYYLTNIGIDLYPIIYELHTWSPNYFQFEIAPVAKKWMDENLAKDKMDVIKKAMEDYRIFRFEKHGI